MAEAVVGSAGSLNPLFAEEDNAREINSLIYQGLTTVDSKQLVVPLLAKSVNVSDDHLAYTVRIRTDVRWADGPHLSQTDVLFTYRLLQDPAYNQPDAQFWREVKIEAAGDDTVRFTLKAPSASFPLDLRLGILPAHVFGGMAPGAIAADPHSRARAFGTGPFQVESISSDRKVVTLKRNPRAVPQPFLDHLVFRSYPSLADALDSVSRGEADTVGALQAPQIGGLAKRPDLAVHEFRSFGQVAILFNLSQELSAYYNPPAVRQALNQAIDRRKIIASVLDGRADPAPGPIPPTGWAYDPTPNDRYHYDPVAAAKTLDEAGWVAPPGGGVRSRDGRDFSLTLSTPDAYPYKQVSEEVARQLALVGVQAKVETVPASVLVGRMLLQHQYQMAAVAFDNGADPDQYSLWHSGPAAETLNFASVLTPRQALIDKDLEDGRMASDRSTRLKAYTDFQDLMAEAAPAIFLYEPHYFYVTSKRVMGFSANPVIEPIDRFQFVAGWYVAKGTAA